MKKFLKELFASAVAVSFFAPVAHAACPQPVYIIAHRCNAGHWVRDVVAAQGVNAVEADFQWHQGNYWVVGHDLVGHTNLDIWLWYVKTTINQSDSPLALVVLDIKTPNLHLEVLYDQVRAALGPDINLIFSIGNYKEAKDAYENSANQGFITKLNEDPRAGAAIDMLDDDDDNQDKVQSLWSNVGMMDYWFADGYSAAGMPAHVTRNVLKGMKLRAQSLTACDARLHGVYTWTYEENDEPDDWVPIFLNKNLVSWPTAGVNGIMLNASECFGLASPWTAEDPYLAVYYTKNFTDLTGTKFADRERNPFKVPAPKITKCPTSTTVECSAPGGVDRYDPQLDGFFKGTKVDTYCDAVDVEIDTPVFFHVNETAGVTFTAADRDGCRPGDSCEANVTVADTIAPTITGITATPGTLWPPNGKMVPVTLKVTTTDVCDTAPACQITSVTSNQPESAVPGDRWPDWKIIGAAGLELRAERLAKGNGRVYAVTVECADASGNRTQGAVEIVVPHDQRHGATVRLSSKRRK